MGTSKASWKLYVLPVFSLCITTLLYSNCQNEVQFDKSPALSKNASSQESNQNFMETIAEEEERTNLTPTQVEKSCQTASLVKKSIKINFPDPGVTCDFGKNGNLEARNQYLQARIEQKVELPEISNKAVICDLDFKFAAQKFLFDDHFLMTFNEHVLAASIDMQQLLPVSEGLLRYDWAFIAGARWNSNDEGTYCAGMGDGKSECSWPRTDMSGEIKMHYDPAILYKIMSAKSKEQSAHSFQFITIGDNDTRDCEHSDISFDVEVSYYE